MLITILSIAFVFIITLIIKKCDGYVRFDGENFILIMVFGIMVSLFFHLLTIPLTAKFENKTFEKEIAASKCDARTDGYIKGSIFYVRGKVEDKDYYFVLTKNNGIYKQEKVPVEKTVIVETNETPRVIINKEYYACDAWSNWIRFHDGQKYYDEQDTIYVPIGTIENNAKFEVF